MNPETPWFDADLLELDPLPEIPPSVEPPGGSPPTKKTRGNVGKKTTAQPKRDASGVKVCAIDDLPVMRVDLDPAEYAVTKRGKRLPVQSRGRRSILF
jgi:hypothetical protein